MICFKDKTFCYSDCINEKCHRYFSEKLKQEAIAWGGEEAPIAMSDFSEDCPEYIKYKGDENGESDTAKAS